jgi:hypothetical protein
MTGPGPRGQDPGEAPRGPPHLRRHAAIRDLCATLKRAVTKLQLYDDNHEAVREVEAELSKKSAQVLAEHGDVALTIGQEGFLLDNKPAILEEDPRESPAWPLHLDGVHRLTFRRGMTAKEMAQFARLLRDAMGGRMPEGHSVSTRFWEMEFAGIELEWVETFSDTTDPDGELGLARRRQELAQFLDLASLPDRAEVPGADPSLVGTLPPPVHVTAFQLDAVRDLALPDLRPVDPARPFPAAPPLNPDEKWFMVQQLQGGPGRAVERALPSLWLMSAAAAEPDWTDLRVLVGRVAAFLLKAGLGKELGRSLRRVVDLARMTPERMPRLEEFMAGLAGAEALALLARDLDAPDTRQVALGLVKFAPARSVTELLDLLPQLKTAEARREYLTVFANRRPSEAQVAERLNRWDPSFVPGLLQVGSHLTSDAYERLLLATLGHAQAPVRVAAARHLAADVAAHLAAGATPLTRPPTGARMAAVTGPPGTRPPTGARMPAVTGPPGTRPPTGARMPAVTGPDGAETPLVPPAARKQVHRLLYDQDAAARQAALEVVVRARDGDAVVHLNAIVDKDSYPVPERQVMVRALVTLGGRSSVPVLRKVLQADNADAALRASCAQALATLGDEGARPAMLAISGKFFVNRALKEACQEAVKRLDARKGPP